MQGTSQMNRVVITGMGVVSPFGPGVETKLKDDKNLLLFRTKVGFDWHHNSFSYGPFVSYDLIEDATDTLYLGFAVGYGL